MQKGNRERQPTRILTSILAGGVAAFGLSLLVLAAAAAAISSGVISEQMSVASTVCAVAVGGFGGGLLAAIRAGSHILPSALAAGVLCALFWPIAGLLTGGHLELLVMLRTLGASLVGSGLAGFLCPSPKKRRK